jgi:hypothetical protein
MTSQLILIGWPAVQSTPVQSSERHVCLAGWLVVTWAGCAGGGCRRVLQWPQLGSSFMGPRSWVPPAAGAKCNVCDTAHLPL